MFQSRFFRGARNTAIIAGLTLFASPLRAMTPNQYTSTTQWRCGAHEGYGHLCELYDGPVYGDDYTGIYATCTGADWSDWWDRDDPGPGYWEDNSAIETPETLGCTVFEN